MIKKIIKNISVSVFVLFANVAFADSTFKVLVDDLPNLRVDSDSGRASVIDYINTVYNSFFGLAAVLAVLMIVVGGFMYLSSDAITNKTAGRERIRNAVIGLLIVLGSYMLLNTVDEKLVKFRFANTPLANHNFPSFVDFVVGKTKKTQDLEDLLEKHKEEIENQSRQTQETINAARLAIDASHNYKDIEAMKKILNSSDGSDQTLLDAPDVTEMFNRIGYTGGKPETLEEAREFIVRKLGIDEESEKPIETAIETLDNLKEEQTNAFKEGLGDSGLTEEQIKTEVDQTTDLAVYEATVNAALKDSSELALQIIRMEKDGTPLSSISLDQFVGLVETSINSLTANLDKMDGLAAKYDDILSGRIRSDGRRVLSKFMSTVKDLCKKIYLPPQTGYVDSLDGGIPYNSIEKARQCQERINGNSSYQNNVVDRIIKKY